MAITHENTVRTAFAELIRDRIDAGSAVGSCDIFDADGILLATVPLEDPCGVVTGPTLDFTITAAQQDPSIDATGTATDFALLDSDNNAVFFGTVSATGGGGDMIVSSTAFTQNAPVNVTAASYTASL